MNPFLTVKELKLKLERREISSKDLRHFYADRIAKHNPSLNAVIELFAQTLDSEPTDFTPTALHGDATSKPTRAKTGEHTDGTLAGIPLLLKDNICQAGQITSAGSKMLANYKAPYDATVTACLKQAGAIPVGRGNMDEFAMGGSGEYSAYGATKNPWNINHVPGGSSAGPAAAVAAGLIPAAIGTETGGSVRQPAAFCNLVGLYPTYGLVSRYGLIAFASSTDQAGPITRTVYDNALILSAIAGQDQHDSTSLDVKPTDYTQGLDGKLPKNLKIGVIKDAVEADGIDPQVRHAFQQAIEQLQRIGATISYIDLPNLKYGIALYFIISRAEAASNLYRYDGTLYGERSKKADSLLDMYLNTRQDGFGAEVKRRILVGNYVLSAGHKDAYYTKAITIRNMLREEFNNAFNNVDLLISPTTSTLPFKLGEMAGDPLAMYMADYFNVPNCIIGTPGLSVPCGFSKEGLPVGIQFLGPRLSEALIYKVGHAFQESTDYHLKTPKGYE